MGSYFAFNKKQEKLMNAVYLVKIRETNQKIIIRTFDLDSLKQSLQILGLTDKCDVYLKIDSDKLKEFND
jgi:archaellum biogenesis ATPase FlaH